MHYVSATLLCVRCFQKNQRQYPKCQRSHRQWALDTMLKSVKTKKLFRFRCLNSLDLYIFNKLFQMFCNKNVKMWIVTSFDVWRKLWFSFSVSFLWTTEKMGQAFYIVPIFFIYIKIWGSSSKFRKRFKNTKATFEHPIYYLGFGFSCVSW